MFTQGRSFQLFRTPRNGQRNNCHRDKTRLSPLQTFPLDNVDAEVDNSQIRSKCRTMIVHQAMASCCFCCNKPTWWRRCRRMLLGQQLFTWYVSFLLGPRADFQSRAISCKRLAFTRVMSVLRYSTLYQVHSLVETATEECFNRMDPFRTTSSTNSNLVTVRNTTSLLLLLK